MSRILHFLTAALTWATEDGIDPVKKNIRMVERREIKIKCVLSNALTFIWKFH
jgi:hypothetical protein